MSNSTQLTKDMVNLAKELKFTNQQVQALNKFATFKTEWVSNVIIPFSDAYKVATLEYQKEIDADIAAKKQQVELAFMALSLFGGTALTAVLGKAALGKVMENMALNYICERNMTRTFNLLAVAKESPVIGYLTAQTAAASKSWITGKTKSAISAAGDPSTYSDITDPALMKSQLEQFYNKSELSVRYALTDLLENKKKASLDIRRQALNKIMQSPFCQSPKQSFIVPKELAKKIELGFYMKMLLESDFTQFEQGHGYAANKKSINESPNSAKYPIGGKGLHTTSVNYGPIGDAAGKKMNKLYNHVMKTTSGIIEDTAFGQRGNREVLKKAEAMLDKVGTDTNALISARIKRVQPITSVRI